MQNDFVATVQIKVLANAMYHILLIKYIHNLKKRSLSD